MRYRHDDWNPGSASIHSSRPFPKSSRPASSSCGFLTDRRLSDEMRYILDRRAAKTFPGSMLPRPGLLLNRWTEEDMFQDTLLGGARQTEGRVQPSPSREAIRRRIPRRKRPRKPRQPSPPNPSAISSPNARRRRFNLTPQADGSLTLPLGDFAGCQFLKITATDAFADDTLILPLPASDTPLRDRRIARPLDPQGALPRHPQRRHPRQRRHR
jgi:hypothetical protein